LAKAKYTNENGTKVRKKVEWFIPRIDKFTEIIKSQKCNAIKKNSEFQSKLDDLFDIVNANALDVMSIEEDGTFLIAQQQKG